MGTWTIASSFEISVGTVTGVEITVDYLAGKDAEGGGGDMLASTYDPTTVAGDAFDMDNMVEGATNKILTATERSEIAANTLKVTNATHTGEVTGATALTVDKTAITNKTLVTAAVGDHILVADASDTDALKKVTVQTIVDLAAGGTQYQIYESIFSIDSANVLQWMTAQSTTVVTTDYSVTSSVNLTDSITTILPATLRIKTFLGVAKGTQTVESLTLSCVSIINAEWTHVSIFKVKHDINLGFIYATELYTNRALAFTVNPILRTITIPAASFTVTSIADGDVIYMACGASSLNDILPCEVYLKCSID